MSTEYNYDYKTKYEFKQSVKYHADIVFEWQGTDYGIFWAGEKGWYICLTYTDKDDEPVYYDNIDGLMNHKIGDDKLIDICTKFTVIERTFLISNCEYIIGGDRLRDIITQVEVTDRTI